MYFFFFITFDNMLFKILGNLCIISDFSVNFIFLPTHKSCFVGIDGLSYFPFYMRCNYFEQVHSRRIMQYDLRQKYAIQRYIPCCHTRKMAKRHRSVLCMKPYIERQSTTVYIQPFTLYT